MPLSARLAAQDNYEIQVYGSETVAKGRTMVELHSNYTANGFKIGEYGQFPDNHEVHETIEITHGWTPWFETGFYILIQLAAADGQHTWVRTSGPGWLFPKAGIGP